MSGRPRTAADQDHPCTGDVYSLTYSQERAGNAPVDGISVYKWSFYIYIYRSIYLYMYVIERKRKEKNWAQNWPTYAMCGLVFGSMWTLLQVMVRSSTSMSTWYLQQIKSREVSRILGTSVQSYSVVRLPQSQEMLGNTFLWERVGLAAADPIACSGSSPVCPRVQRTFVFGLGRQCGITAWAVDGAGEIELDVQ